MPRQGISAAPSETDMRDIIRDHLVAFSRTYDVTRYFMSDKNVLSIWLQAIVPTWHEVPEKNATQISTRISSFHLMLAPEFGPKARALAILKRVLEHGAS